MEHLFLSVQAAGITWVQCLSGGAEQPETNPVKTIDKPLLGVPECFVFNMSLHIQLFLISARMLYQANSEIKQKYKMKIKYNKMNKIKIR